MATQEKTYSLNSSSLSEAISDACSLLNIIRTDYFAEKSLQFYDTLRIRSGIMIIGQPFSGKTVIRLTMAKALSILEEKNLMNEKHVLTTILNPKSMTIQQLHGAFESTSNDWCDGVFSINFKQFANHKKNCRKWLVLDGPVEVAWMENLKSVLDDNRKLCLMSGDVIHLNESMNLIFETLDLKWASPSIVRVSSVLSRFKIDNLSFCIGFLLWSSVYVNN